MAQQLRVPTSLLKEPILVPSTVAHSSSSRKWFPAHTSLPASHIITKQKRKRQCYPKLVTSCSFPHLSIMSVVGFICVVEILGNTTCAIANLLCSSFCDVMWHLDFLVLYSMYMGVFAECIDVCHVYAWCLRKLKKGWSYRQLEPLHMSWELNLGPLEEQPMFLAARPSLWASCDTLKQT